MKEGKAYEEVVVVVVMESEKGKLRKSVKRMWEINISLQKEKDETVGKKWEIEDERTRFQRIGPPVHRID